MIDNVCVAQAQWNAEALSENRNWRRGRRDRVNSIVVALICWSWAGIASAQLAQEISNQIEALGDADYNYKVRWVAELPKPQNPQGVKKQKVDVLRSVLVVENTYSASASEGTPYLRIIEEYRTNGFKTFREGGVLENGKKVTNESDFESTEQPVIGVALFASKYYQARLLRLLTNPSVNEVQSNGNQSYVISGQAKYRGVPLNLRLMISKSDYLLLELHSFISPDSDNKLLATRAERNGSNWPYSRIRSEVWQQGRLISKNEIQITAERALAKPGEELQALDIPLGTMITDKRFGYGVVYKTRKEDSLTDEQIARMSTDPDFRTNRYFLSHYKMLSKNPSSSGTKRSIVICIILAMGLAGILTMWLRRNKLGVS